MATTMHCGAVLWPMASLITCGLAMAAELKLVLSAPALSSRRTSSTVRTPPPTVSGMKTCEATASMIGRIRSRPSLVAVMSRKGELVGALLVVARGDLDRVARVAQFDEVDALDPAPPAGVTSRQGMMRLASMRYPSPPASGVAASCRAAHPAPRSGYKSRAHSSSARACASAKSRSPE